VPSGGPDRVPRLAEVRVLESQGDLLAAERGYLARYIHRDALREIGGSPRTDGYEGLTRVYQRLGWRAALEVLELASDDL
jgi:hypothetical protein